MSANSRVADFLPVVGSLSITSSYAPIGNPTTAPLVSLVVANDNLTGVFFSIDGINDHIFVPRRRAYPITFNANKTNISYGSGQLKLPKGTQFYVRSVDPGPFANGAFLTLVYEK